MYHQDLGRALCAALINHCAKNTGIYIIGNSFTYEPPTGSRLYPYRASLGVSGVLDTLTLCLAGYTYKCAPDLSVAW